MIDGATPAHNRDGAILAAMFEAVNTLETLTTRDKVVLGVAIIKAILASVDTIPRIPVDSP